MKFLFFTRPDDAHAVAVRLVLETLGHQVWSWFGADQPSLLSHSVWLNQTKTCWNSMEKRQRLAHPVTHYDVVWYRRPQSPKLFTDTTHPDDQAFVKRENKLFVDDLSVLISKTAWWVNPLDAARKAHAKITQLQLAKLAGLSIPDTLCSNCPADIRAFMRHHQAQGVIYKPLCSTAWVEPTQRKAIYTTQIDESHLPHDALLRLTPGIFQSLIKKQYELRVTCFGSYCVAVKLASQDHEHSRIDWRASPVGAVAVSLYTLPKSITLKLNRLMRSLGIVFGCVDLIVTPEQEYVFLEINEQGQFLWIEEQAPDIALLDCFIQFILGQSFEFRWSQASSVQQLATYQTRIQQQVQQQLNEHLYFHPGGVITCVAGSVI